MNNYEAIQIALALKAAREQLLVPDLQKTAFRVNVGAVCRVAEILSGLVKGFDKAAFMDAAGLHVEASASSPWQLLYPRTEERTEERESQSWQERAWRLSQLVVDGFNAWRAAEHARFVQQIRSQPERYGNLPPDDPLFAPPVPVHRVDYEVGKGRWIVNALDLMESAELSHAHSMDETAIRR